MFAPGRDQTCALPDPPRRVLPEQSLLARLLAETALHTQGPPLREFQKPSQAWLLLEVWTWEECQASFLTLWACEQRSG